VLEALDGVPNFNGAGLWTWNAADLRNGVSAFVRKGDLPGVLEALSSLTDLPLPVRPAWSGGMLVLRNIPPAFCETVADALGLRVTDG
jgi:hypothetical protein